MVYWFTGRASLLPLYLAFLCKGIGMVLLYYYYKVKFRDYDIIGKEYNRRGINFIIIDYRGYGLSNGEPTSQNILSDSIEVSFKPVLTPFRNRYAPRNQSVIKLK